MTATEFLKVFNKLLILAGTSGEAGQFARDFNIPITSILYIKNEQVVRGLSNPQWIVTGRFWERLDAADIWIALQRTQTRQLDLPVNYLGAAKLPSKQQVPPKQVPAAKRRSFEEPIPQDAPVTDNKKHFKQIIIDE
jgi:hypothetical protein